MPQYCPDCDGSSNFTVCTDQGVVGECPQPVCPPSKCSGLDATACAMNGSCHAVYQPGAACGCATPGCCTFFSFCADGATATCSGTPTCEQVEPLCEGDYVISYTGSCYEGCVLSSECAP
jgi:hypothetical protein